MTARGSPPRVAWVSGRLLARADGAKYARPGGMGKRPFACPCGQRKKRPANVEASILPERRDEGA